MMQNSELLHDLTRFPGKPVDFLRGACW